MTIDREVVISYTTPLDAAEACRIGIQATPRVAEMASVRCISYLRDLHRRMTPHCNHPAVIEFSERARPLLSACGD